MAGFVPSSGFDFISCIEHGDHVAWPQGTGEPLGLTSRLFDQASALSRPTLVLGMTTSKTLSRPEAPEFDYLCMNGASDTRRAVALSRNRVIPAHLSAIPDLIINRVIPVDIALIRVRPTGDKNVYSLGVVVDFVHEMIDAARVVVAEIDERMPLTCGDTLVRGDQIDLFTVADRDEPIIIDAVPGKTEMIVASRVAAIIPDRATVQFGVGGLPVAVAQSLGDHKDLGLHSGVIPDAAVELIEAGVITNKFKGIDEGISVTGGLFGTRKLFDFADGNGVLEMRRASFTHAASTMAQIRGFHTVNSAVAIDLSGQVNAEVAGGRYVGAVGGQIDFVRGGRLSSGGRSIMALASTTPDGKHSKIVADLSGQPVTTARSDVDMVVTEYGVAELWGRDLFQRAKALIAIAHPDFQEALERQAHATFERSIT
jgi:acyl-CoA hydrolase